MKFSTALRSLPLLPLTLLLSALFSAWIIYSNPILNDDAFTYLQAAELFNQQGLLVMLDTYGWYGYSVLIGLLAKLLPGDMATSAHLINSLCYLLLTWSFIRLSELIWPAEKTGYFAALVILGFPLLNEMRFMIIRDAAFWAFSLTALLHLIRFNQYGKRSNALLWCLCSLLAVVFRLEALLFLIAAPLALLFGGKNRTQQLKYLLHLEGLLLLLLIGICLLAMAMQIQLSELMRFAYRYYLPLLFDIGPLFKSSAQSLNITVFSAGNFPNQNNLSHGMLLLTLTYCYSVIANLVNALSVPLALLLAFNMVRGRLQLAANSRSFLVVYGASSLLSLLLFQFIMHFQTQRYATLLCLLLLLLLPGILGKLSSAAKTKGTRKRFNIIFACFCVYFFTDSLISFGYSTSYIVEANKWVSREIPPQASLATNIYSVAYEHNPEIRIEQSSKQVASVLASATSAEYLVFKVYAADSSAQDLLEQQKDLELLTQFGNQRGDEVRIYRRAAFVQN